MTTHNLSPHMIDVEIDPKANRYLFWTVMWITAVTVVGIPFMPIIAIIYWAWYAPKYREFHTLTLTDTGDRVEARLSCSAARPTCRLTGSPMSRCIKVR